METVRDRGKGPPTGNCIREIKWSHERWRQSRYVTQKAKLVSVERLDLRGCVVVWLSRRDIVQNVQNGKIRWKSGSYYRAGFES